MIQEPSRELLGDWQVCENGSWKSGFGFDELLEEGWMGQEGGYEWTSQSSGFWLWDCPLMPKHVINRRVLKIKMRLFKITVQKLLFSHSKERGRKAVSNN